MQIPKTKRLRLLIFSLLLVLTVGMLAGCSHTMKFSIGTAAKITVRSGRTGKTATVTDAETIRKITDNVNQITYQRSESSVNWMGSGDCLIWYGVDGKQMEAIAVYDDDYINYRNYFWESYGPEKLDTELYDQLLKNAESD